MVSLSCLLHLSTGCEAEWRYTEAGERVRVSKRSGLEIPLPPGSEITDDLVRSAQYKRMRYANNSTQTHDILSLQFFS